MIAYAMFLFLLAAQLKMSLLSATGFIFFVIGVAFFFPVHSATLWVDTSIGIEECAARGMSP
jgi:hypothetical protein